MVGFGGGLFLFLLPDDVLPGAQNNHGVAEQVQAIPGALERTASGALGPPAAGHPPASVWAQGLSPGQGRERPSPCSVTSTHSERVTCKRLQPPR